MREGIGAFWRHRGPWFPPLIVGAAVALVMAMPPALVPVAQAYATLCARYPMLALLTNHAPALPVALLLSLAALALIVGGWTGVTGFLATIRCNRQLHRRAAPLPTRLARLGDDLGLVSQVTYLAAPEPMACCYGLLRPRIAITAGLVERLDDTELAAVLLHEGEHLRRRDPLRYLVLETLTAAAFMLPLAAALRERAAARIELAADRAALTIVPRAALAGALLASVVPAQSPPGIAGLTATEARIAHLAGRTALPPIPAGAVVASLGMTAIVVLAAIDLAAAAEVIRMNCPFCPWFM
jgi:Zn-dependent protease with chaperone function